MKSLIKKFVSICFLTTLLSSCEYLEFDDSGIDLEANGYSGVTEFSCSKNDETITADIYGVLSFAGSLSRVGNGIASQSEDHVIAAALHVESQLVDTVSLTINNNLLPEKYALPFDSVFKYRDFVSGQTFTYEIKYIIDGVEKVLPLSFIVVSKEETWEVISL